MFEEKNEKESTVDRDALRSPTRNRDCCKWYSIPGHDERFFVSESVDESDFSPEGVENFRALVSILDDRFFLAALHRKPIDQDDVHFMSLNKRTRYVPFAADFGPPNLAAIMLFCQEVQDFLVQGPSNKLVFYTSPEPKDLTNSIFLCGAFMVVVLHVPPAEAMKPFANIPRDVCLNYRDATWDPVSFELHLTSCWSGLERAMQKGVFNPLRFDPEEYLHYDDHGNGNLNTIVEGKFVAFKSPREKRAKNSDGTVSHTPADYINVLKSMNVEDIIRLNGYSYDPKDFVNAGFRHHDINYNARATPSDATIDRFLSIAESSQSVTAVHCSAGLGRTQTLIGLFLMKAYGFTAEESIGWLRIARPGSIIGPQQHFLKSQERRLWDLGRKGVIGLGLAYANCLSPTQRLPSSATLFDELPLVRQGGKERKFERCTSSPTAPNNFKIVIQQEGLSLSRLSSPSFSSSFGSSTLRREQARQSETPRKQENAKERTLPKKLESSMEEAKLDGVKEEVEKKEEAKEQWQDEFEKLLLGDEAPPQQQQQTSSSSSSGDCSLPQEISAPMEAKVSEQPAPLPGGSTEEQTQSVPQTPGTAGQGQELPDKDQWQEEFEALLLGLDGQKEFEPLALNLDAAEPESFFDLQETFGRREEACKGEGKEQGHRQCQQEEEEEGRDELEMRRYAEEVASLTFHAVSGRCISPELKPSCVMHSPEPFDFSLKEKERSWQPLTKTSSPPPLLPPPLTRRPASSSSPSARLVSQPTRTTAFDVRRMKEMGVAVSSMTRRSRSPQGRSSYPPYDTQPPCRRTQGC